MWDGIRKRYTDIDFFFIFVLLCLFYSVYEYSEHGKAENPNHPTYKHKIYFK